MRNYFSQLAKQSGLHFKGQGEKTPAVKTQGDAPLEQENTILVAPDYSAEKSAEKTSEISPAHSPKAGNKTAPPPVERSTETAFESTETIFVEAPGKAKTNSEKSSPDETTSETVVQNQAENLSESEPTIEQFVFKDAAPLFESTLGDAPKSSDSSETRQSPPTENASQYFKKTGEMLEKGEPDRLKIQQILLREVQEWAADTPDFAEIESEIVEAKEPRVKILPPLTEEKVVFRDSSAERESEAQNLEEQNFNLSIGTISIVIEDTEKPPPTENISPKTSSESKTAETKRPFSRLSRNYL